MKKLKFWLTVGVVLSLLIGCSTSYAYQALELNGSGYASIADASQAGLDVGLSDFMAEAYILSSSAAKQPIVYKSGAGGYFDWHINVTTGFLECVINDGTNTATITGDVKVTDNRLHILRVTLDKSSATGGRLYVDGVEDTSAQTDLTSVLNIDNDGVFYVGYDGADNFVGRLDEVRFWNFGYGGLPADVATYATWRAGARNIFLDISEYDSDSWSLYADADRTEIVPDSGIESWTGDTPDIWGAYGASAGVRDFTDETVVVHGGSHAAKLEVTNNDGSQFYLHQPITLVASKRYEAQWWSRLASRTAGTTRHRVRLIVSGVSPVDIQTSTVDAAYVLRSGTFTTDGTASEIFAYSLAETTTGVLYYDDISVKRVGLVGHWKFEGDYLDEGSNDNDLTAGGSGNAFPGYTLKRQKIISPAMVK